MSKHCSNEENNTSESLKPPHGCAVSVSDLGRRVAGSRLAEMNFLSNVNLYTAH